MDPRVAGLERAATVWGAGRTVGIVDNGKLHGFVDALEQQFLAAGASSVDSFRRKYQEKPADDDFVTAIADRVEVAVVGLGN
jgi:hypothetical protein